MDQSSIIDETVSFEASGSTIADKRLYTNIKENLKYASSPMLNSRTFVSSTLNESTIAQSLELCNISSLVSSTTSEHQIFLKNYEPTNSTPIKDNHNVVESEFFKKHTQSAHSTPSKSASLQKLGSPERNEILYGSVRSSCVQQNKQRFSPAKKRLFDGSSISSMQSMKKNRLIRQHLKHDPIAYFFIDRNLLHIVEHIFCLLTSDEDLYNCQRVSGLWSRALWKSKMQGRLRFINRAKQVDKENKVYCHSRPSMKLDYPINGDSFLEIAKILNEQQHLEKCPQCGSASIVEQNIGQCQKFSCGYIYCRVCNSCSTTGPENFTDQCQAKAHLLVTKRRKRRTLLDSPPRNHLDVSTFFFNSSSSSSSQQDSGYQSEPTNDDSSSLSLYRSFDGSGSSHHAKPARKSLGQCNRNLGDAKNAQSKLTNYVPVQRKRTLDSPCGGGGGGDVNEPPSPPKVRNIAGSARSKRNLKRLLI